MYYNIFLVNNYLKNNDLLKIINLKMKNKDLENNFDKYLWNRYIPLHDRLTRKISYLSKVYSNFNDIYHVKKDYYKTLKPIINTEIPQCKEESHFPNIINIVKTTNDKYMEFEEAMYIEIIANIKDLIDKMKNEKNYYEDFLKYLSLYKEEKKKMEKNKSIYHSSALIAEKSTIYLKDLVIKKKLNNDSIINQQIEISENESKNRLIIMSKDCNNYIQSLDYVNNMRIKLNKKQKRLLKLYEELEKQDKNLYKKVMEIIRKYQKKILDFTGEKMSATDGIIKSINIDRDIRELVESLRSREKPEEKIPYVHYPTEIDFDKCCDSKDYRVVNEVVKAIKQYSKNVFMDYDEALEGKKNKMRELIYKFFDMNKTTELEDRNKLLEYIKDEKTHELFLIVLSKLRTNNRFCRDKPLIDLLSEIFMKILNVAQKKKDFLSAKNCIILSQTFYYNDESTPNKKIYIIDNIKNHQWLKSIEFWKDFTLIMILNEFKKLEEMNKSDKMIIAKNKNIPENAKSKIGEILFSQLLPYVGNMKEFNVEKKYIIKILDDINNRYKYMCQTNLEDIYDLVCNSKEELQKIKEEIKNDKELVDSMINEDLIKESIKSGNYNDEDDEDEEEIKIEKNDKNSINI